MLVKRFFVTLLLALAVSLVSVERVDAQCAMCTLNAENSTKEGNMQGKGLNDGILFLLAMPFIIGGGIAVLWYTKFRTVSEEK